MTSIRIESWSAHAGQSWQSILLGNGASIALHAGFGYGSLLQVAQLQNNLPSTGSLFSRFGTQDFERVLLACWHAEIVNQTLGAPSSHITAAYTEVRDALVAAVHAVHCQHSSIAPSLALAGGFLSQFPTILTFCYDVSLYWAMMDFNGINGNWFKDCFVGAGSTFDLNWPRLRSPYRAAGASLVFYPHGSLIVAQDLSGQERKIVTSVSGASALTNLLNTITSQWQAGTCAPVFVSEGTHQAKLASIRRSHYLNTVYDDVLSDLGDHVVVYGLSFAPTDEHVMMAMQRRPPKHVAVSVFTGRPVPQQQAECHAVLAVFQKYLPSTVVTFFDSSSSGCWNNP